MSRYIPMPAYIDRMPVDISFVFEDEKPAGKRGFIRADGEDLRFEDGTLARFWGVNVNGGACFPDKDYAPKCARRLAQAGCNLIRFHQLDAQWDTPNLFAYTKGKRVTTTRELDKRSLDALDYFIACLKEEGIYIYLDMMTYRKFKEGDGVVQPELLVDGATPWSITNRHLIDLQKEFITQIWTHVNPYTGLAYKDDPAFVLTELVNETDLFYDVRNSKGYFAHPYYIAEFRQMFRDYLAEQKLDYDWENCDLYALDEPLLAFKLLKTKDFYRELYDHMRAVGVKIPITGTNWTKLPGGLAMAQAEMDFSDSHGYFYDWQWGNQERICLNRPITAYPFAKPNLGKMDLAGKPFFVSEWDMPWPNSYRAEGPIYFAALGCLQGWSGFAIHTYAYSSLLENMKILGRELSSPVAGVPYREGIFSVWNDPAKFGLFYHAALMTRRCDITPANKKVAVQIPRLGNAPSTAFRGLLEQHRGGVVFDNRLPEGYDELVCMDDNYPNEGGSNLIVSDNGQMWRDLGKKVGVIDSPRTKCVYGSIATNTHGNSNFTPKLSGIALNGMEVVGRTDFGVIALSSLTDAPIEESDNMLLSTIGRARNTDACFDGEKMLDVGKPPIMAEVIQATIRIKTCHGQSLKVWGVNAEGFYSGEHPTTYEDGWLQFEVGDIDNPASYYLIVKE